MDVLSISSAVKHERMYEAQIVAQTVDADHYALLTL